MSALSSKSRNCFGPGGPASEASPWPRTLTFCVGLACGAGHVWWLNCATVFGLLLRSSQRFSLVVVSVSVVLSWLDEPAPDELLAGLSVEEVRKRNQVRPDVRDGTGASPFSSERHIRVR